MDPDAIDEVVRAEVARDLLPELLDVGGVELLRSFRRFRGGLGLAENQF